MWDFEVIRGKIMEDSRGISKRLLKEFLWDRHGI